MESATSLPSWPWLAKGFAPTRWSLVRRSTGPEAVDPGKAAEIFCRVYWYPLYSCLRGKGYSHIDAQDHVQSFLARLIQRGALRKADPARGRLRFYLTTLVLRHASGRHRAGRTVKRGGAAAHLPIDWSDAEASYQTDYAALTEPEAAFRRGLAVRLVDESVAMLEAEFDKNGRGDLFEALLPSLEGTMVEATFAELAERLGMSHGALRVAACRLRDRFRKKLRQVAAEALGMKVGPELDTELREIFG